jgi:hypothetical protein
LQEEEMRTDMNPILIFVENIVKAVKILLEQKGRKK